MLVHVLVVLYTKTTQERALPQKTTVQKLNLKNVAIEKESKPILKPKNKSKHKAIPKVTPKPKAKIKPVKKQSEQPIVKEEIKPEPVVEEDIEQVVEQQSKPVPIAKQAQLLPDQEELLKANYIDSVKAIIEANKYYPKNAKRRKQEDTVEIRFTILADGSVINIELDKPSRYQRLNKGTLTLLKKIGSFKPIPKVLRMKSWEIVVPIAYQLR